MASSSFTPSAKAAAPSRLAGKASRITAGLSAANSVAQFLALCSGPKTQSQAENLRSDSEPNACSKEKLSHGDCVASPSPLPLRNVSILHPCVALERSAPPVSPLSEPQRRSLGHLPRPAGPATLPLQSEGLHAHLQ